MKNMYTDLQFWSEILLTCLLKLQKLTPSEVQHVFWTFAAAQGVIPWHGGELL